MIEVENEGTLCRAQLRGEMTIYNAVPLKQELVGLLGRSGDLELDLSGITDIDTAGVQLLMLLKRECAARDRSFILSNHSGVVLDIYELMGLVGYFSDPVVLTKARGGAHGS